MTVNSRLSILLILVLVGCKYDENNYSDIKGEVFGTYYRFQIDSKINFLNQIDSVFTSIDRAVNSYIETSEITQLNRHMILVGPSPTFINMLEEAKKYNQLSEGYFEPTLYPLISAWSLEFKNRRLLDSNKVDSLLRFVSFNDYLDFDTEQVKILKKGAMIDLSALGEGYAIDAVTSILDHSGVSNYMIEIGGEMKCKGKNPKGEVWKIGIEDPEASIEERGIVHIVKLKNKALSTSGNYRKFYTDSLGNKYSHIIDPKTGYPAKHTLLSASILSNSATTADALATACMAMGTEKSMLFIEKMPNIEGVLIYIENGKMKTWQSGNFPE